MADPTRCLPALLALACLAAAPAPRRWSSPDGSVRLLRPAGAPLSRSEVPLGSLMAPGWRLVWGAAAPTPGRLLVRFALPVRPIGGGSATEVLQIGVSTDPATLRTCLTHGLDSGSGARRPDRTIHGIRFRVHSNGDAGMSQQIAATDLRAVVGTRCYAVDRFAYRVSARDPDPAVTLGQAQGAARLDAALASLRITPPRALVVPARAR